MNTRDHLCIYELWKYFLKQSKSFVLHQNQVSSCKGYGYWFKKFKDFPCLSELWWCTLSVATFRPTLDSTFSVITTRLGRSSWWSQVHPVHISSFLLMTPWCWLLYLCSISCLHHRYQPAVDRRQHVAGAHNGSKASLTLCSPQQWLMAAAANLRATDVRSRCSMSLIPAPGSLLPLSWKSNLQWSHCVRKPWNNQNPKSVVTLGRGDELDVFNFLVGSNKVLIKHCCCLWIGGKTENIPLLKAPVI